MSENPIENYLDDLFVQVRTSAPREARSLLAETDAHLRDAVDDAMRAGMSKREAELAAIDRFGDPVLVAAADRGRSTAGTPVG